ncbi:P-loop containing nucleoside triphosphate hydrolase protein [Ochromonadaceae sp. CCMP2298]|nr:P-loop containing nucleoside triphosphate hydrolase protein [Ochromonadaceae sp. CCMP2298]
MSYTVGERYWIPDEAEAWMVGSLKSGSSTVLEFSTDKGARRIKVSDLKNTKLETCGSHIDDNVENLVDLDELSEGAILHHVRNRFCKQQLDIYGPRDVRRAVQGNYPHVYVTAANAYAQLQSNCKNQSVLISGESGAGKTETTKKVLAYLANVAPGTKRQGEVGMEDKILQSNPLLEALGNAKTLRNNNSSRFGKWMAVGFDAGFAIQGCQVPL